MFGETHLEGSMDDEYTCFGLEGIFCSHQGENII
jgi:hypothetical protein